MSRRTTSLTLALFAPWLIFGCRDLDRFDTSNGDAYCGAMVSAPVFHEGFVNDGAPPVLRLRLELDTEQLTMRPGTLTSDDAVRGLCSASGQPMFSNAPLRGVPDILHDPVSLVEFSDGHDHNFFAYVDSTCLGTMLALVSLMRDGNVEMRLFKPAALDQESGTASERPGFAVFHLKRQAATSCGF